MLAYASENNTWSQPWYYPRKPQNSNIESLYIESPGRAIDVIDPMEVKEESNTAKSSNDFNKVSPINEFNKQHSITAVLSSYGYKRILVTKQTEKWLSPSSKSHSPGVTVKGELFFCHHGGDKFNDGYWHDAFDLMRVMEGLSQRDAVIKASQEINEFNSNISYESKNNLCVKILEAQPLPDSRPSVLPLEKDMLPESIRDYIFDVAERQQSLPDYVAVAAIVGLSSLLGRKALIYPKQFDDWSVIPNQWGAIIGRPSAMKSPSMKEALKPLMKFENESSKQFLEDKKNYEEDCQLLKLEKSAAEIKAKSALKSGNRQEAKAALRVSIHTDVPIRKRLVINDTTVEKLGELLNENLNGLLLIRDELSGWLAKLYTEKYQPDRSFYLECFDGNGSYIYDRIERGTIEIQNCILSIIGGIQPSKIASLVRDAIKGTADDGLIQRLQLAIWPDDIGSWEWVDRFPKEPARENYKKVFEKLHNLNFNTANGEPRYFRFTEEAQKLFIDWIKKIQNDARNPEIHPVLESHMLKMPKTIAGLALLFEIIDGDSDFVGVKATKMALNWADYLLSHAVRLYSLAINHSLDGAKLIISRKDKLPNQFSVRDIYRKGWSGLSDIESVNESLYWLVDYGYVVEKSLRSEDTNGRPKLVYEWNI